MTTSSFCVVPVTTIEQRAQWDEFASRSTVGHMRQCLWWAQPLSRYGVKPQVLGCWSGGELVGGALFRSIPMPLTNAAITECLNGPIFLRWQSAWAEPFAHSLVRLAGAHKSSVLTIRACPRMDVHRDILAALLRLRLRVRTAEGTTRAILPLNGKSTDELVMSFNTGTRRNIRKGVKTGVQVRTVVTRDELRNAYAAWTASADRKHFSDVRPWAGLEPVLQHCIDQKLGAVHGSFVDGRIVAAIFVSHFGDTTEYVYGGYVDGADQYRPNHLLHDEAIRESLRLGMSAYDFGNLLEPSEPNPCGIDRFKLGFGAKPIQCADTIIWERKPLLYRGVQQLRRNRVGRRLLTLVKEYIVRRRDRRDGLAREPSSSSST
jgi:hypothetical protein